jgi:UDP-N-acetylglucosamine 4-epimerase
VSYKHNVGYKQNVDYKDLEFDRDSIFLVTGGAGFIGSNLCEALLDMGYQVRCMDNFSTGKRENIEGFLHNKNFTLIEDDIRNLEACLVACEGVDYVLHQAAWGSVPRSIEMPLLYEEINIRGTLNMMEAARQQGVKKFVYASSSSVYGDHPVLPKKEGQEGELLSPYALTKRVDEEYGKLYKKLYGLDTGSMSGSSTGRHPPEITSFTLKLNLTWAAFPIPMENMACWLSSSPSNLIA